MKKNYKLLFIFIFALLNNYLGSCQFPISAEKDFQLSKEIERVNRLGRDNFDKQDSIFFYNLDTAVSDAAKNKNDIANMIVSEMNNELNSSSLFITNKLANKLLGLDTEYAYGLFIHNKFLSYLAFVGDSENNPETLKTTIVRNKIVSFILFSDFLNDKEYFKEPYSAFSKIGDISLYFGHSQMQYISIIEIIIENTYNENKQKNLEAILRQLKK